MDLRKLDESSLQKIKLFAERLVELKTANGELGFADPNDLEQVERQAEKQALQYAERRKAGYKNSPISEDDDEITNSVRDFIRRRSIYRNENQTHVTKPSF